MSQRARFPKGNTDRGIPHRGWHRPSRYDSWRPVSHGKNFDEAFLALVEQIGQGDEEQELAVLPSDMKPEGPIVDPPARKVRLKVVAQVLEEPSQRNGTQSIQSPPPTEEPSVLSAVKILLGTAARQLQEVEARVKANPSALADADLSPVVLGLCRVLEATEAAADAIREASGQATGTAGGRPADQDGDAASEEDVGATARRGPGRPRRGERV